MSGHGMDFETGRKFKKIRILTTVSQYTTPCVIFFSAHRSVRKETFKFGQILKYSSIEEKAVMMKLKNYLLLIRNKQ
ncbi:hypothetical protein T4D_1227 [Trichinella pseudospiralis]|uniref:Uncharacterized protein n=1 Tax=Trichinella pseudospiralis TaxID=6337 RepID=A0A0V1FSZ5_TRIPS|nr:hypothetical protein T4D_1227 [Trichinella pseudospiralis]